MAYDELDQSDLDLEYGYLVAAPRPEAAMNLQEVIANTPRLAMRYRMIDEIRDVPSMLHVLQNERPAYLFLHVNLPGLNRRALEEARRVSPRTAIVGFVPLLGGREDDIFESYGLERGFLLREDNYTVTSLTDVMEDARERVRSEIRGKTVVEHKTITRGSNQGLLTDKGVIVVNSAKGGAGKTFVSIHVAAGLAQAYKVLLLDINPSGGMADDYFARWVRKEGERSDRERDKSLFAFEAGFGWDPSRPVGQQIDPAKIEEVLTWVIDNKDGSGLAMIHGLEYKTNAPERQMFRDAKWIPEFFDKCLRAGFKYIVVDTGQEYFVPVTRAAIERADLFVEVCNGRSRGDSKFSAKQVMDLAEKLGDKMTDNRMVVVNQWTPDGVQMSEVKKWYEGFGAKSFKRVKMDNAVANKVNHERTGAPVFFLGEQSEIRTQLTDMVNTINFIDESVAARGKKGLGGLFSRGR